MSETSAQRHDDHRRAFIAGFATELGKRFAAGVLLVVGLLLSAALVIGGLTLLLGVICVLLLALLVLAHRRHRAAGGSTEPTSKGSDDDDLQGELTATRRQLAVLQERHRSETRRTAELQATIEEFRRTIGDLRAIDHEKSQRLDVLHRMNRRNEADGEVILDLLLIAVEEAEPEGVLRIAEPTVLLERLIGAARAALSKQRAADVGLAMIAEDGACRRVMNSAGIRRNVLEDTSRPLVDVPIRPEQRLYPVRLPEPFADHRLIALFDGEPTTADTGFLHLVAAAYANILLLVRATSRARPHA